MPSSRTTDRRFVFAASVLAALVSSSPARTARAGEPTSASASGDAKTGASKLEAVPAPGELLDGKPARPPPLAPPPWKKQPWDRIVDVGGDFAVVARPSTTDVKGRATQVRYQAATGFALHIRWPLLSHFTIEGYYVDVHMPVILPRGSLGLGDALTSPPVETYVFGARISPSMTWGPVTAWLTAGAGWGRFEFRRMTARTSSGETYTLRERGSSFVEIPLGIGVSWEIVKHWISFDVVSTAAFVAGQHGDALDDAQTIDATHQIRNVGGLPVMDASLVQTLGFSLLL